MIDLKKIKNRKLAEGEMTGHAHILQFSEVHEIDSGLREFEATSEETLTHEEHREIKIPKGKYKSGKVLEYDHFLEETKEVQD